MKWVAPKNIQLSVRRCHSGKSMYTGYVDDQSSYRFEDSTMKINFSYKIESQILQGKLQATLENPTFREPDHFEVVDPIQLYIPWEQPPRRVTALYLHRPWWTRPAFLKDIGTIPAKTQCVLLDYGDTYGVCIAFAGHTCKTTFSGQSNSLVCHVSAHTSGLARIEETLFFYSEGECVFQEVTRIAQHISKIIAIPLRQARTYPDILSYLGWCSWDAFYHDISGEKVIQKAQEIKEKNLPVRWMLFDDGWLTTKDEKLFDFVPDSEKFPGGFTETIHTIKELTDISDFGVWHALGGYWGGVHEKSQIYHTIKNSLYQTISGKLIPYPEKLRGEQFFSAWYNYLKKQGITFVKVDGQSAVAHYFENNIPICQAAKGIHEALEAAVTKYFDGCLINCMGMAMENILARCSSAVSRNSDDFTPDNSISFQEHVIQNVYNSVYHNAWYVCDWDMFWTDHKEAEKHALLRAISGGPIYISDAVGKTCVENIMPLISPEGKIYRLERSGLPALNNLFGDPQESVLQITNFGYVGTEKAGAIGVFNFSAAEKKEKIQIESVPELEGLRYLVYNYFTQESDVIVRGGTICHTIPPYHYEYYIIIPLQTLCTPIGIIDKYNSFLTIQHITYGKNSIYCEVDSFGQFAFFSENASIEALVDGQSLDITYKGAIGIVTIEQSVKRRIVCLQKKKNS